MTRIDVIEIARTGANGINGSIALVADTASVNLTNTTGTLSADVLPAGVAHQSLSGAGSNDHPNIDAHIGSLSSHSKTQGRATLTATTSAVGVAITGITFNVVNTETWCFDIVIAASCSTVNGVKFSIGGTSTASSLEVLVLGNRTSILDYVTNEITAKATLSGSAFIAYIGTGLVRLSGTIIASGTGTVTCVIAAATGGDTATAKAGSYFTAARIA